MFPYIAPTPRIIPAYYDDDSRVILRYDVKKDADRRDPLFVVKMGHRTGIYRSRQIAKRMTENYPNSIPTAWDTQDECLGWLYSSYMHEIVQTQEYHEPRHVVYAHANVRDVQCGSMAGIGCYFGQSNECNFSGPLIGFRQTKARGSYAAILQCLRIITYRRDCHRWQIRSSAPGVVRIVTRSKPLWNTPTWNTAEIPSDARDLLEEIMKLWDQLKLVEIKFVLECGGQDTHGEYLRAADRLALAGVEEPVFYMPEGN